MQRFHSECISTKMYIVENWSFLEVFECLDRVHLTKFVRLPFCFRSRHLCVTLGSELHQSCMLTQDENPGIEPREDRPYSDELLARADEAILKAEKARTNWQEISRNTCPRPKPLS